MPQPGTVAQAETHWNPFPFGSDVTISDFKGRVIYTGTIDDVGPGWSILGVPPDDWIDTFWNTQQQAKDWGSPIMTVRICWDNSKGCYKK
jgi:hypothetical protein